MRVLCTDRFITKINKQPEYIYHLFQIKNIKIFLSDLFTCRQSHIDLHKYQQV